MVADDEDDHADMVVRQKRHLRVKAVDIAAVESDEMSAVGGGFARHAVSAREDGNFKVDVVMCAQVQSALRRLPVCEACLIELSFDDFSKDLPPTDRVRALAGFTVTRFFEKYRRNLLPDVQDVGAETARLQKLAL